MALACSANDNTMGGEIYVQPFTDRIVAVRDLIIIVFAISEYNEWDEDEEAWLVEDDCGDEWGEEEW